jgi:hypothetical protein
MSKRTWAVLAAVAVAGWMTGRAQARQAPIPAPPGNNQQQDDRRKWDHLHYLHVPTQGLAPRASEEVPAPAVPETKAPSPEFRFNPSEFHPRFNPSEFHPPTTAVSEVAPAVGEAGTLFRGGGGALAGAGGGLAALFASLFGRGKKGPKE